MPVLPNSPLTWFFVARYADGTVLEQTPEDASRTGKGSAFTDVLADLEAGKELESFFLVRPAEKPEESEVVAVDLRDGHFELNGKPFWAGNETPPPDAKLRLIYHRRNSRDLLVGASGVEGQTAHRIRYFLGWQTTTIEGKNLQQKIGVD